MLKKWLGLILLMVSPLLSSIAQNQSSEVDSLIQVLKTDKNDTTKLIHMYAISDKSETAGRYKEGISYGMRALRFSDSLLKNLSAPGDDAVKKTILLYKSKAYSNIGIIQSNQGDFGNALQNHFASLKIRNETGNKKGISGSYNNIGAVYIQQGNYPEALNCFLLSLKISEEINNRIGVASAHHSIATVYYYQQNYSEALKHDLLSLEMKEKLGDIAGVGRSCIGIGSIYKDQGNLDKGLAYYRKSIDLFKSVGDIADLSFSYSNIGDIYFTKKNYEAAKTSFFQALKIREEMEDKEGIANCYLNIGCTFLKQKKYIEAEKYLLNAKKIALEISYKEYQKEVYFALVELDSARGNFKGAFENHKLFMVYRDSLDNEQTRKKTIQNQMTFDFEKKEAIAETEHKNELEKQSALSKEEKRKQNIILVSVFSGFLLVLLFSGIIFRSLRVTKKQKRTIEDQKMIVEGQKQLVEEKQKEILDSIRYAKRIQQSLLPTEKYITKHLSRMKRAD